MTQPQTAQIQQYYSNLYEKMNYEVGDNIGELRQTHEPLDFVHYILSQKTYADKTIFIWQILQSLQNNQIISLHKPPKWGKTLNISMLYHFLNCLCQKKQKNVFDTHKSNNNNKYKFRISQQSFKQHFEKKKSLPVIFLKFGSIKQQKSQNVIKQIIKQIKSSYHHIKQFIVISEDIEKDMMQIERIFQMFQSNSKYQQNSVQLLSKISQLILKSQKKQCYLLVDDYSFPYEYLICKKAAQIEIFNLHTFWNFLLFSFCSANKKNKVVLVGKLNIGLYSYLSCQNIGIRDVKYSEYFGLSLDEIKNIIDEKKLKNKRKLLKQIETWYNGYIIQKKEQNGNSKFMGLYNSLSVINYLEQCLKADKIQAGKIYQQKASTQLLFSFIKKQNLGNLQNIVSLVQLIKTFNKKQQTEKISMLIPYAKKQSLIFQQCFISKKENYSQSNIKMISKLMTYLLLSNGFITGDYFSHCNKLNFYFPNKQHYVIFSQFLRNQLKQKNIIHNFSKIPIEDAQLFILKIEQTINKSNWKCYFPSKNESNYHSMIYIRYGLSQEATHKAYTEEASQNGKIRGKVDNIFYPRSEQSQSCFIHEYKFVKSPSLTQQQKQLIFLNGFYQILTKGYMNWSLTKNKPCFQYFRIKQIVIRVIICHDKQTEESQEKQCKLYVQQKKFTLNQAFIVKQFFQDETVQSLILKNKDNYQIFQNELLELTIQQNLDKLLNKLKKMNSQNLKEYLQPKKQLFKRKRQENFQLVIKLLQIQNIKKLNYELITEDIFNLTTSQLIQISDPAFKLTQQEAQELKQQLQTLRKNQPGIFPLSFIAGMPKKRKPE